MLACEGYPDFGWASVGYDAYLEDLRDFVATLMGEVGMVGLAPIKALDLAKWAGPRGLNPSDADVREEYVKGLPPERVFVTDTVFALDSLFAADELESLHEYYVTARLGDGVQRINIRQALKAGDRAGAKSQPEIMGLLDKYVENISYLYYMVPVELPTGASCVGGVLDVARCGDVVEMYSPAEELVLDKLILLATETDVTFILEEEEPDPDNGARAWVFGHGNLRGLSADEASAAVLRFAAAGVASPGPDTPFVSSE